MTPIPVVVIAALAFIAGPVEDVERDITGDFPFDEFVAKPPGKPGFVSALDQYFIWRGYECECEAKFTEDAALRKLLLWVAEEYKAMLQ